MCALWWKAVIWKYCTSHSLFFSKVGKQNIYLELCPSVYVFVFACSKQIKVSILFLPTNLGVPVVAVVLYCGRPKMNRSLLWAASVASAPVSLFPSAAAALTYNNGIIRSITIAITSGHQGISVTPSLFSFSIYLSAWPGHASRTTALSSFVQVSVPAFRDVLQSLSAALSPHYWVTELADGSHATGNPS